MEPALTLTGPVTLASIEEVRALLNRAAGAATVDLSAVTELDTAGAWVLLSRTGVLIDGADAAQDLLLQTVRAALPGPPAIPPVKALYRFGDGLAFVGAGTSAFLAAMAQSLGFLGLVVARLAATLARPRRLRMTATVHHMQEAGLNAVPIVALMGFLIGVVLAFQGATCHLK